MKQSLSAILMLLASIAGADDGSAPLPVVPVPDHPDDADVPVKPESDATVLEDVVVTATKRYKRQRDLPGSVGVLRGEDLDKLKAQSLGDYVNQVPGVVLIDRGADGSIPIIRGISTSTAVMTSTTTQLPVGIYVDDMPFTDLYLPFSEPDLNPFDLQRVEILKGPQGTLFGSGALAGGIRYVLQKPKLATWEAKLSETIRSTHYSEGLSPVTAAALNVPLLGSSAALRAVGTIRNESGLIDEAGRGKDVDKLRQYTGRALAHWDATDRLGIDAFYFRQQSRLPFATSADNPHDFDRQLTGVTDRKSGFSGGNLVARYAFDWGDLLSSSNYLTKDVRNLITQPEGVAQPTGDPTAPGGANGPGSEDAGITDATIAKLNSRSRGLFQEIRVASPEGSPYQPWSWMRLEWLAGAAYQRTAQDVLETLDVTAVQRTFAPIDALPFIPLDSPVGPINGSRDASLAYAELNSVASELALFGETTARFGQHWEATAGARLFTTRLLVDGFASGAQFVALSLGQTRSDIHRVVTADGLNPKLSLRYLFNENVQLYALASKGFQFGGIQLNPALPAFTTTVPEAFAPYKSSKLWNYEIGVRNEFFQRRLRFDVTAFYLDWTDLQITVRKPIFPNSRTLGLSVGFVQNIGRAKSEGIETSFAVTPFRGLDLTSSLAWMKAVTTEDFDSAAGLVAAGTRLPGSPRFQCSNILSYSVPVSFLGNWQASASASHAHVGGSYNDLKYSFRQGGYDTVDFSLGLRNATFRLQPDLTISLLNAADRRGISAVSGDSATRDVAYFFVRPRTLLVSLGLRY